MALRLAVSLAAVLVCGGCRDALSQAPAQAVCARVSDLCHGNDHDRAECERTVAQLDPSVDADNLARTSRCMAEARTCGEASGCMAGAAVRAGANFVRDFANGFTR